MSALREDQGLELVVEASDREVEQLLHDCASAPLPPLHPRSIDRLPQHAADAPRVLFIGDGRARRAHERLSRWPEERQGEFDLLISHDEGLFEQHELLSHTPRILAAPYDLPLLHQHLALIAQGPAPEDPIATHVLEMTLVGDSAPIQRLTKAVGAVARYQTPVLVTGETGTGKELVARAIHYAGPLADHPFVPVNCGALSDELLLAELFGHEKGAFTDAKSARPGLVAEADGGTLMLDEVDSLSPKAQAALLRFLQDKEYRPVGGDRVMRAEVRVISATNQHLKRLVEAGRFREDLYYRLHVVEIQVPPLRRRGDDVTVLAEHFLGNFARQYDEAEKRLHPVTLRWMRDYRWPGNVRELENYLHRIFVMTDGPSICVPRPLGEPVQLTGGPASLREQGGDLRAFQEEKARIVADFERAYLHRVMKKAGGNISQAARLAGKERRAFDRLLKKYGISRGDYR